MCQPPTARGKTTQPFLASCFLSSKVPAYNKKLFHCKMPSQDRHGLDDASLGEYLVSQLPSLKLPILSTKIGYGQSNPTYFVDDAA